ncbi:translocation/assembly module TamB domain-containing protein [Rufibacter roseus]|uniref:Translocation/assembly module TamB domain-containing protein n=1 Tax=Rufibacter roseus TaxID=1567108 RepID=A0ABW2DK90_9BACT|nr:translocation/assembly module TamB domain-containing protein [Rufibacter roseus]
MSTHTLKKYTLKTLSVILWIIGSILFLVVLIWVALLIPAVQDFATQKAENWLENKIGTKVEIGKFRSDLRKDLLLENVYLEDRQGDTLWYSEHLAANLDIFGLIQSKVGLSSLELRNATAHIERTLPDSAFNFNYILEAFATPADTAAVDTTSAGFTYDIGSIDLQNIYLTYKDEVNGQNVRTRVGNLNVGMDELDLEKEIYRIGDIALKDTWVDMVQTKVPPDTEEETPLTMQFGLKNVALDRVKLKYRNGVSRQYIDANIGTARLDAQDINLEETRIDLNTLELHNSVLAYGHNADLPAEYRVVNPKKVIEALEKSVEKSTGQTVNWVVRLDKLNVTEVDASFTNYDAPKQPKGLDPNYLLARNLNIQLQDLYFSNNSTTAQLNQLSFQEQSGFEIERFTAGIVFDSVQTELNDLVLKTGNSRIARHIRVGYPSLETAAEDLSKLTLNADFENTYIGFEDIALLQPALANQPPIAGNLNQTVRLNGSVNGRMDNLLISNLRVSGWRNTELAASGRIRGLPNVDNLFANVQVNRLHTTAADIKSLLPAGTLPANITLPPSIDLEGSFSGSMTAFDVDATLRTTFGNAIAKIDMEPGRAPGQEQIDGTVRLIRFDLGRLLQDTTLGRATLVANIDGTGITPENMVANIEGTVQSLEYNGYNYQGIAFDVDANRNSYAVNATSTQDENLDFDINGTINLRGEEPVVNLNTNIRSIDFQALNLYPEDLRLRGDIKVDINGANINTLDATISATDAAITTNNQLIEFDTLNVTLAQRPGQTELRINSDVLTGFLDGNIPLGELAPVLMAHIDRYYDLDGDPFQTPDRPQQFTFGLDLHKPRVLTAFVPGLDRLRLDTLYGSYDSRTANLQIVGQIPRMRYSGFRLDSIALAVDSNPDQLNYNIRANQIRQDTSFRANNIVLSGNVQDNVVALRAANVSEAGEDESHIGLRLQQIAGGFEISLAPDLLLNRDPWQVTPDNFIRYFTESGAMVANNLNLSNGPMAINLQSQNPNSRTSPLSVNLQNIDVGYFARAIMQQDSLIDGTLNGQATITDPTGDLTFTADMNLANFKYQNMPVGDLTLDARNAGGSRYEVTAALTGNGNNVTLGGYYLATGDQPMSFDVNFEQFNLASVQPFTYGMLKDMSGAILGSVAIRGTMENPSVAGDLRFNDAAFNVAMLNSVYRVPDERLTINNQGIRFDEFALLDSLGNQAVINGQILTTNFLDYRFDLRATTDDFLAINSTAADNSLYYGTVYVDSDTRITGDLNVPIINTTVTVGPNSNFTYVMPDEPVTPSREGIVVFVDVDSTRNRFLGRQKEIDTVDAVVQGIDLTMTLSITDDVPITVIVDANAGDHLTVRGNSTLNVGYDVNEDITLTGRFDVTEGAYEMSLYELVERRFEISPESYIVWNGDMFDADANITAIYNVDAAPYELMASQLSEVPDQYKQKLPFEVHLNMKGELMNPAISFNIELEDEARGEGDIEARLEQLSQPTQESERTKQVFSLLVLGRFMAPDPLASSGGGGLGGALRGSASGVLTDQLNALTGKYLGGLGLDLGVNSYEDYSTGEAENRTQLNVALQQQLLNDRLTIRFGKNFDLEGSDQGATANASGFAGDVSVEYSITPDGRLRMRVFRQNSYEGFLDGQLMRTGLTLIYQKEYDNLSELFKNTGKVK